MRDYQERVKFVKRRFRPPEKIERGLKNELDPLTLTKPMIADS